MSGDTWLGTPSHPSSINPGSSRADESTSPTAIGGGLVYDSAADWAVGTVVWLGTSVGAGVLGAVAYDGIRLTLHRLRRHRGRRPIAPSRADAVTLAGAVVLQARLPSIFKCQVDAVDAVQRRDGGWRVFLGAPRFNVVVDVEPYLPGNDHIETRVSLTRPTPDELLFWLPE